MKIAILDDSNKPILPPFKVGDDAKVLPIAAEVFGGTTPAETAEQVLAWLTVTLTEHVRAHLRHRRAGAVRKLAEDAADVDFDNAWTTR